MAGHELFLSPDPESQEKHGATPPWGPDSSSLFMRGRVGSHEAFSTFGRALGWEGQEPSRNTWPL